MLDDAHAAYVGAGGASGLGGGERAARLDNNGDGDHLVYSFFAVRICSGVAVLIPYGVAVLIPWHRNPCKQLQQTTLDGPRTRVGDKWYDGHMSLPADRHNGMNRDHGSTTRDHEDGHGRDGGPACVRHRH